MVKYSIDCGHLHIRWECVFLPDQGAFFLNNVVSMAMMGAAVTLLNPQEVAYQIWIWATSLTPEEVSLRTGDSSRFDLWYGEVLVWNLVYFTIILSLAFSCPVIGIPGTLYLILSNCADGYNLARRHYPTATVEGRKYYLLATTIVLESAVLLQFFTLLFLLVATEGGGTGPTPHYSFNFGAKLFIMSQNFVAIQHSTDHTWPVPIFPPAKENENGERRRKKRSHRGSKGRRLVVSL
jgi:hypothetical protein